MNTYKKCGGGGRERNHVTLNVLNRIKLNQIQLITTKRSILVTCSNFFFKYMDIDH